MRNKTFERRFVMVLFCLMASLFLVTAALGAEEGEKQAAGDDANKAAEGEPAPPPEAAPAKPAEKPAVKKPEGEVPWPDAYQERQIPFQRELSEAEYEWLGRRIWESMQKIVPREHSRGLGAKEIHALMLEMRRNRGEASLQMGDFLRILSTRSKKCGGRDYSGLGDQLEGEGREPREMEGQPAAAPAQPEHPGQVIGFDVGRLRAPRH